MTLIAALTAVIDRLIQLAGVRDATRQRLLNDHASPAFEAFSMVHEIYLTSFRGYRETIRRFNVPPVSPPAEAYAVLRDLIETDNRFNEHHRSALLVLDETIVDERIRPMVRSMRDYLVDVRIAGDPVGGYGARRFANPQLWRRTLLTELDAIFEERWTSVLDPVASSPPLYGEDLEAALLREKDAAGIRRDDPDGMSRLKTFHALRAVDEIVDDMQEAFGAVHQQYAIVRKSLSS